MDGERNTSGKSNERPITRWRREQDAPSTSSNKIDRPPTGIVRPQSKYERPRSRRGHKDESEYVGSANFRSATPGRLALARPPSASFPSNRAPTAGLTRISSGLGRSGTGLPTSKQFNVSMVDRPITQHGIAGMRPGTTRGLPMRQIQDKRYYEGLLQLKIRELTQEIGKIMKDIEIQNKEKATFLHYDKRAKSLAAELTILQAELADYNLVVDKMTLDVDKEVIEQEAKELALMNEQKTAEVERMFEQRKQMEQKLHKMEKDIDNERKRTEYIIENMDPHTREKYDDLLRQKTELQEQAQQMQRDLDQLSKEQMQLEEQIALSQLKQEAVKLQVRIIEAEEKRDKLREEEGKRLSPEDEKEQLLQKIKRDNTDIAATEAQIAEKEKKVMELEQQLEQLETDMEDNHSEKQTKYQELRKREEMMEEFMSTYEQNKQEELEKLSKLEREIVEKLEAVANAVENNEYLTEAEETAILRDKFSYNDYEIGHRDDDFDELKKDYMIMQQTFNKLRILEEKLQLESKQMKEKLKKQQSELIVLEDLDGLKTRNEFERDGLIAEREGLVTEETICEDDLKLLQTEYNELKERLEKYPVYPEINNLEEKLEKLKEDNKKNKEFIIKEKERVNYEPFKEKALKLIKDYNVILQENLKSLY
ncbi:Intraflagellar transport protein 74-like protein [Camponotus floridanus]|uniref:Intraflagellar transport protein 74-like protein n=2 Tax=Camponotus floridanus TaxID=104421 RepID=E2AXP2_CAMFO|nr:intraflagellar transport protein 74 homolog isoform X2 [Camponotus floridanus]XP_025269156.1 intraflagellar transport protein 74 homolog isoform X2 [Camponotus floridanus]EFN61788.1 Intraflagellar transport protein 74-like protein [Camponotus floridanus]